MRASNDIFKFTTKYTLLVLQSLQYSSWRSVCQWYHWIFFQQVYSLVYSACHCLALNQLKRLPRTLFLNLNVEGTSLIAWKQGQQFATKQKTLSAGQPQGETKSTISDMPNMRLCDFIPLIWWFLCQDRRICIAVYDVAWPYRMNYFIPINMPYTETCHVLYFLGISLWRYILHTPWIQQNLKLISIKKTQFCLYSHKIAKHNYKLYLFCVISTSLITSLCHTWSLFVG